MNDWRWTGATKKLPSPTDTRWHFTFWICTTYRPSISAVHCIFQLSSIYSSLSGFLPPLLTLHHSAQRKTDWQTCWRIQWTGAAPDRQSTQRDPQGNILRHPGPVPYSLLPYLLATPSPLKCIRPSRLHSPTSTHRVPWNGSPLGNLLLQVSMIKCKWIRERTKILLLLQFHGYWVARRWLWMRENTSLWVTWQPACSSSTRDGWLA